MKPSGTLWPGIDTAYTDEFGPIDPVVYREAACLWGRAEKYALSTLGDGPAGLRLMIRAVAVVSRVHAEQAGRINDLRGYLFQTYKRLVLGELEKENGHRRHETEQGAVLTSALSAPAEDVDRKILVEQLMGRMDAWTREIFELLVLGHGFEEIGQARGQSGGVLRSKFHKRLKRLMKEVTAETTRVRGKPRGAE